MSGNERRKEGIEVGPVKRAARIALAVVLVSGGLLVLPRSASRVLAPDATAQVVPTPTLPPLPLPTPSPSDPSGGGGGGGGGNESDPEENEDKESNDNTGGSNKNSGSNKNDDSKSKTKAKGKARGGRPGGGAFVGGPVPSGTFSTDKLVAAAARLRAFGMPSDQVIDTVYPPFIIAGQAAWTNTWGAPRFGPGPAVRTHEGQDVFCRFGDPILAPEAGTVSYSDGGLGGLVARVHTSGNAYWYLAHLETVNNSRYPIGSSVQIGDVIGTCGNSGNAITTPPHVHFGRYVNGRAVDPMNALVKWLRAAHRNVGLKVDRLQARQVEQSDRLTLARRFGDAYTSDLSTMAELAEADSAPKAIPSIPLAEAALQAALEAEFGDLPIPGDGDDGHDHDVSTPATSTSGIKDVLGTESESHD